MSSELCQLTIKNLIILFVLFLSGKCVPIKYVNKEEAGTSSPIPSLETFTFLKRFGYLEQGISNSEAMYTEEGIKNAVKNMQRFGDIPQTGIIDNATVTLMKSKRCGVADITRQSNTRSKRYAIVQGWKKRHISYFIANWSPEIGERTVSILIQKALDIWGEYGRLNFHAVNNPSADIVVAFGNGHHGDPYPFDGVGGVLAHAFFPYETMQFGGDIHFDADEKWSTKTTAYQEDATDFFSVALHELGHSLGLSHSPISTAVMFPYYKGETTNLDYDDILGMYELYIKRQLEEDLISESSTKIEEPTTIKPDDEDETSSTTETISTSSTISTITSTTTQISTITNTPEKENSYPDYTEGTTTFDLPEILYTGDDETVDEHKDHDDKHGVPYSNLPNICDGYFDSVTVLRGELFVFKEKFVWRLKRPGSVEPGYPVPFYRLFPKLPHDITKIDGAYQRNDGAIIFFTDNLFWVYDGTNLIDGSPRPLTDYGLPSDLLKIDAVQLWEKNKKVYFYYKNIFWRYNETLKQMDEGYPKNMDRWRGIPNDLDAAITWLDGSTYFFKDTRFWRFDNFLIKTIENYPLPAPQIWLGCPEKLNTVWWSFPWE